MQASGEQFICYLCDQTYSHNDRLKAHLEKIHDITVEKRTNRFVCPFNCDQPAFRTMTLLLAHCEHNHESTLGQLHSIN